MQDVPANLADRMSAYAPTRQGRQAASVAQVAYAVRQSQAYTDTLIADMRSEVQANAVEAYRNQHHSIKSRVTMHVVLMSVGMCIALLIPSAVVIGILATGMPSLIIEITDHYAVVASAAIKYARRVRPGKR